MHEAFMRRALRLARDNLGRTSPNPSVGALVVKDGEILSHGVTEPPGGEHAEIVALRGCDARGATMYVTLEPCCNEGRTGPCTEAIIDAGVARVVVAVRDRNPDVDGQGLGALEDAGIEVTTGILEERASALYAPYFHHIITGKPFVTLKVAQTLDGKMTWGNGRRKKITGAEADSFSHALRKEHDAIVAGVNTVLKDDPRMTCRHVDGPNPVRVILDSTLRMPADARLLGEQGDTVILCTEGRDRERQETLGKQCEIVVLKALDVDAVLDVLGKRGVTSVLVEGGPTVASSFLDGHVHRMHVLIGPFAAGEGKGLARGFELSDVAIRLLGKDILVTGNVRHSA